METCWFCGIMYYRDDTNPVQGCPFCLEERYKWIEIQHPELFSNQLQSNEG